MNPQIFYINDRIYMNLHSVPIPPLFVPIALSDKGRHRVKASLHRESREVQVVKFGPGDSAGSWFVYGVAAVEHHIVMLF